MTEPVSIRAKNPGAQWPGPSATKFGSKEWWPCGGNNKIAVFPTFEQGGAATFDLWARRYSNMTLEAAILKWSGHNSSKAYADFLAKKIPGLTMDTMITKDFLRSDTGWRFMKYQSQWEAGKPYPMTDEQWKDAQDMAFGPKKAKPTPAPAEPLPPAPAPLPAPTEHWFLRLLKLLLSIFKRQ